MPGGIEAYWNLHLSEFAQSTKPLRELFPAGAFHLYGTPKVFAPMGITLAFYTTAKKEKRKQVLALMIPAALTAMLTGITEPIEFTFLFIAPVLFLVHAILCACSNMAMYIAGVRGAFANGLIAWGHRIDSMLAESLDDLCDTDSCWISIYAYLVPCVPVFD